MAVAVRRIIIGVASIESLLLPVFAARVCREVAVREAARVLSAVGVEGRGGGGTVDEAEQGDDEPVGDIYKVDGGDRVQLEQAAVRGSGGAAVAGEAGSEGVRIPR